MVNRRHTVTENFQIRLPFINLLWTWVPVDFWFLNSVCQGQEKKKVWLTKPTAPPQKKTNNIKEFSKINYFY